MRLLPFPCRVQYRRLVRQAVLDAGLGWRIEQATGLASYTERLWNCLTEINLLYQGRRTSP